MMDTRKNCTTEGRFINFTTSFSTRTFLRFSAWRDLAFDIIPYHVFFQRHFTTKRFPKTCLPISTAACEAVLRSTKDMAILEHLYLISFYYSIRIEQVIRLDRLQIRLFPKQVIYSPFRPPSLTHGKQHN